MTSSDLVPRVIPMEGAVNFRDLGGYRTEDGRRINYGKLFRSDHLAHLSPKDWERFRELGIELVHDLRGLQEREHWSSNWNDNMEVEVICRDYAWQAEQLTKQGYHSMVYHLAESYAELFDRLADPVAPPTLFHCTAGQDRTGFAAVFLLMILGVDQDTIIEDFSLSHELRGAIQYDRHRLQDEIDFYGWDEDVDTKIASLAAPDRRDKARDQINNALAGIAADHGSVMNFIRRELRVSDSKIKQIRARLL